MSVNRWIETSTLLPFCWPHPICGEQKWEVNCCVMHPIFYKAPGLLSRYLVSGLYGNYFFSWTKVENTIKSIAFIQKKAMFLFYFRSIQSPSSFTPFIQVFENFFQLFLLSPFRTFMNQRQSSKNNVTAMLSFVFPFAVVFIVYLVILRQFSS